jgi:hypothetical protein
MRRFTGKIRPDAETEAQRQPGIEEHVNDALLRGQSTVNLQIVSLMWESHSAGVAGRDPVERRQILRACATHLHLGRPCKVSKLQRRDLKKTTAPWTSNAEDRAL